MDGGWGVRWWKTVHEDLGLSDYLGSLPGAILTICCVTQIHHLQNEKSVICCKSLTDW